jgi:hypothetical protein
MATYIFLASICLAAIVLGLVIFKPHLKSKGRFKEKETQNRNRGPFASKYRGIYVISD